MRWWPASSPGSTTALPLAALARRAAAFSAAKLSRPAPACPGATPWGRSPRRSGSRISARRSKIGEEKAFPPRNPHPSLSAVRHSPRGGCRLPKIDDGVRGEYLLPRPQTEERDHVRSDRGGRGGRQTGPRHAGGRGAAPGGAARQPARWRWRCGRRAACSRRCPPRRTRMRCCWSARRRGRREGHDALHAVRARIEEVLADAADVLARAMPEAPAASGAEAHRRHHLLPDRHRPHLHGGRGAGEGGQGAGPRDPGRDAGLGRRPERADAGGDRERRPGADRRRHAGRPRRDSPASACSCSSTKAAINGGKALVERAFAEASAAGRRQRRPQRRRPAARRRQPAPTST